MLKTDYQKKIFTDRYQKGEETLDDMFKRVARFAVSKNCPYGWGAEEQEERYYRMLASLQHIPAGRILSNAGGNNMINNCFVLDIEDSRGGIFRDTLGDFAEIASKGGGIGINFSKLRPKGAYVKGSEAVASGPCSFIDVYESSAKTMKQGGSRGLAGMAALNCTHPDIMEFVTYKTQGDHIWNHFNISVGITDAFMTAVKDDLDWNLIFEGEIHHTIKARELWDAICLSAWKSGEPGMLFLDTINHNNPAWYCGDITCTNPCGEQPLLPYSACNLGSINLIQFVNENKEIDWGLMKDTIWTAVAFHDSLIDNSTYPLDAIRKRVLRLRPIGIGVVGLADLLFELEIPYGKSEVVDAIFRFLQSTAMDASKELGETLGFFPAFKDDLDANPRRNSTLISFAPTGSIASLYDVSFGIEPHLAPVMHKNEELGKHVVGIKIIQDYMDKNNTDEFPPWTRFALSPTEENSLSVDDHMDVLTIAAGYSDSGVSKTINMSSDSTVEDIEKIYKTAWMAGIIKGCTVYRQGSRETEAISTEEKEEEDYDIEIIDSWRDPISRPPVLEGTTYRIKPNPDESWLYITINDYNDMPIEIFFTSRDSTHQEYLGMLGDVITTLYRRGEPGIHIVKDLLKHQSNGGGGWYKGKYIPSIAAAIGMIMKEHYQMLGLFPNDSIGEEEASAMGIDLESAIYDRCPRCGEYKLVRMEGCNICTACSYSKCG